MFKRIKSNLIIIMRLKFLSSVSELSSYFGGPTYYWPFVSHMSHSILIYLYAVEKPPYEIIPAHLVIFYHCLYWGSFLVNFHLTYSWCLLFTKIHISVMRLSYGQHLVKLYHKLYMLTTSKVSIEGGLRGQLILSRQMPKNMRDQEIFGKLSQRKNEIAAPKLEDQTISSFKDTEKSLGTKKKLWNKNFLLWNMRKYSILKNCMMG